MATYHPYGPATEAGYPPSSPNNRTLRDSPTRSSTSGTATLLSPGPSISRTLTPEVLYPSQAGRRTIYISGITVLLDRPIKGSIYIRIQVNGRDFLKMPFIYDPTTDTPLKWALEPYFSLQEGIDLTVQIRRRRLWPHNSLFSVGVVSFKEIDEFLSLSERGLDSYQYAISREPSIILNIVPVANISKMLHSGITLSSEVQSVLDHLGKSRRFLETLLLYGYAVSEIDPIAKAVLGCVKVVYKKLREQDRCDKTVVNLARCMARSLDYIADVQQFARLQQLKKTIEDVKPLLEDTTNFILAFIHQSSLDHLFNSSITYNEAEDLMQRFEIFQLQFDRGLAVQSGAVLETLLEELISGKDEKLLQELKLTGNETTSYIPECMSGTREDVLASIDEWVEDLKAPNILWIRGFPGVGKSAIASTLIQKLRRNNRLGSGYIFERAKVTLATPNALWRSVAFDLARTYPTFRKTVVERLSDEEVDVDSSNIKTIFRNLIEEPLRKCNDIPLGRLPVIVVDALDECGGRNSRQSVHREGLLSTLKRWSGLPSRFKIIVTSRGDDDIERALSSTACETVDLSSGHRVKERASQDIRIFLKARFWKIVQAYSESLPVDWPGDQVINELTNRAAGLFIWAKTLIDYVNEGEPNTQLRQILHDGIGLGDIALLYLRVLETSFRTPSVPVLEAFQVVVGAMIFAKRPFSRQECIELLQVEPSMLDYIRKGLHSVMDEGIILRFNHQSFVEFLLDPEKCPTWFLSVEIPQHRRLVAACLNLMTDRLQFNICRLPTSHFRNNQFADLNERINRYITTPLAYASKFWTDHLRIIPFEESIFDDIQVLFYNKLLFWFEVLSIIGEMYSATPMVTAIIDWCMPEVGETHDFVLFLQDALKYLVAFAGVMSQSAPHIYISTLPFSPTSSRVAQHFLPLYSGTLRLQSGHFSDWPRLLFTIDEQQTCVNSVCFSPDGKLIVSGTSDGTVCIWDAETGDLISTPLSGHVSSVNAVAFFADGRRVVSASDDWSVRVWDAESGDSVTDPLHGHTNVVVSAACSHSGQYVISGSYDQTIRLWDLEGEEITCKVFEGHSGGVTAVAFSLDDTLIASGSFDRTVRIWDRALGTLLYGPFEGHSAVVNCVAFSPNGLTLASASDDETIQLWDIINNDVAGTPLEGHTDSVSSISYSSDGERLVSGSHDETLLIWDVKSGDVVCGPLEAHTNGITSVSFSSDGRRVISGSRDETIMVWDVEHKENPLDVKLPGRAHSDGVTSVRFSPDGRFMATGSDDDTVRLWDTQTGLEIVKFQGHMSWVDAVSISPNGAYVASGSDDQTIRVWDVEARGLFGTPLVGHRNGITSLSFFPDNRRIVSGSYDETVRIWDIETSELVLGPLEPHSNWVTSVAVSADGSKIVSASYDQTVKVIDAESGTTIAGPFVGHGAAINSVVFSPDGLLIASSANDHTIRVCDASTGELIYPPIRGHNNRVLCVTFSPKGDAIASGSLDNTVRVWDSRTGELKLGPLEGHTGGVFSVAYSPNGASLASASEDETIRLWDVATEQITSEMVTAVPIDFTDDSGLQSGWIAGSQSSLLFWVPPWNRNGLWWPRNSAVIARTPTRLDTSCFEHGLTWENCRDPSSR